MNILLTIIKRLVMALIMLYTINLITNVVGLIIPINIITIFIVSILGIPGVLGLTVIKYFIL